MWQSFEKDDENFSNQKKKFCMDNFFTKEKTTRDWQLETSFSGLFSFQTFFSFLESHSLVLVTPTLMREFQILPKTFGLSVSNKTPPLV